ncbi:prephenate dehydratase [Neisseriaceae bacterium ESL0693]|nr:prephenate dehydratase [Neisseriaceae bacterium ESL0693]
MQDNEKLKPHRDAIDQIDATILDLLNQRAVHARTIGELKGSGAVYRPEREIAVLQRIRSLNQGPLSDEAVMRLFREVMSACLALERPLNIAYLGPKGTFTEQAAIKHFGHAACLQPCATIDECFRLVEARQADYVVAPVENSTEGSVGRSLDLLLKTPLNACAEVSLPIHHNLLSRQQDKGAITKVYAHAQALAQCQQWLHQHLPANVHYISVASNAKAAAMAAEEVNSAAIASIVAAEHYQLPVLASHIEDEPNNTTRFLILGHNQPGASGRDKTSLIVSTPNKAGAVHHLLGAFARHGISMTKLESRPSHGGLWEYVFFIDIEGHQQDQPVQTALAEIMATTLFLKVIGSYPRSLSI